MKNPIIERELVGALRTHRALALQISMAVIFSLVIVLRWPTDARADLNGAQAIQVFQLFGYGVLTVFLLLVPIFPATSLVREKTKGTLALLLNSPMKPWSIYFGKLVGVLGFVLLLLMMSVPAAAACFGMGGVSSEKILKLYGILALIAVQYSALGLLISSYANSTDSALRITYGVVLLLAVVTTGPHLFLQGETGILADAAEWLRCVSPVPAVMEVLGHGDVGTQGLDSVSGVPIRFVLLSLLITAGLMIWTISRLNYSIFDRARSQGVITDERGTAGRWFRRVLFLIDPQRRKSGIGPLTNPVMVKEFRSRRFGRSHWMIRLIAGCAVISLGLTWVASLGTRDWGVETIGGIMVLLQVALIVLLTPSLAAGLISSERESGGWALLQMTPLSTGTILRGKLMSVVWTLALILCATLPGYLVMIFIQPALFQQVIQVLICLLLTSALAVLLSATVSSFFSRTAPATSTSYGLLMALFAGTMLIWLGRDGKPFGRAAVEMVLKVNPMAAALNVIKVPDFADYNLVPGNWWVTGCVTIAMFVVLCLQTWRLTRPQ